MSPRRLAVPPGRAGRLWLTRRLAVARRGADLLDRKLQVLRRELDRRRDSAARAAGEWERRRADADGWLLRAAASLIARSPPSSAARRQGRARPRRSA